MCPVNGLNNNKPNLKNVESEYFYTKIHIFFLKISCLNICLCIKKEKKEKERPQKKEKILNLSYATAKSLHHSLNLQCIRQK